MSDVMTLGTWSNYETRLANMWLTNSLESYRLLMRAYSKGKSDIEHAEWLEKVLRYQLSDESTSEPVCGVSY